MKYNFIKYIRNLGTKKFAHLLFLIGLFFLPSSLFISSLFLLPSALIGSFLNNKSYFKDKWNYPFIVLGVLILLISLLQKFVLPNLYDEIWNPMLSIYGMGNWLPFIWLFWAFQPYLDSNSKRKSFALVIISGTLPVLITGFGQFFFNWTGPFETLNGLIIWYQRPIDNAGGLSGLFNNQNYAGSWLNFVWPFCLAFFIEKKSFLKKTVVNSFLVSIGIAALLTYSRNAWIGLITSLPIVLGKRGFKLVLTILIIFLFLLIFAYSQFFEGEIQNNIVNLLPAKITREFTSEGYKGINVIRFEIFSSALNLIKMNPIFGIGAAAFPEIYFLENNSWRGHSHNILFEFAISYGLPATIILFSTITNIMLKSGRAIFNMKSENLSNIDKAFWASLFVFLITQLADIQYFDGKISIVAWMLLAGLKKIIEEKKIKKYA